MPFLPPGDLPDPGIKLMSLESPTLAGGFFTTSATWEAHILFFLFFFFKVKYSKMFNEQIRLSKYETATERRRGIIQPEF